MRKSEREKQMHAGGSGHVMHVTIDGGEAQIEHVRKAIVAAVLEAREFEKSEVKPCSGS